MRLRAAPSEYAQSTRRVPVSTREYRTHAPVPAGLTAVGAVRCSRYCILQVRTFRYHQADNPYRYSINPHRYSINPYRYSINPHRYSINPYRYSINPYR